jgi:ketosteroid isomerase-like protein
VADARRNAGPDPDFREQGYIDMRIIRNASALAFVVASGFAGAAHAQQWNAEQQEIWAFEQKQWAMGAAKDLGWIDSMTHDNLSYWSAERRAPQDKASLSRWQKYDNAQSTTLEQELYPHTIAITGDVAVVQYSYTVAREDAEKKRKTTQGRYTDVLIKEGGKWKFIAWAGGDYPEK